MFGECENSAKEITAKEAWNEAKICTYSSGGCGCRSGGIGYGPMWEGTNSVKQEETRTSIIEDPVNTETEVTGTPTPLPTTAPVTGISHTDSYEDLYAQVKEWQNNSSYSNVQPRIMTVEESADAAGTDSAASNSSMAATMPEEPIDQEYGFDPSSEGKDYSTTTTQEELIDEADIVKQMAAVLCHGQ